MSTSDQKTAARKERFQHFLKALQDSGVPSNEYMRYYKDLEDFNQRLTSIEASYASAYEQLIKLEKQLGEKKKEWIDTPVDKKELVSSR